MLSSFDGIAKHLIRSVSHRINGWYVGREVQALEVLALALPTTKRSTDEIIVLALCLLCMMGLLLFAVIRLQRGDVAIAVVDGLGFAVSAFLFVYVYMTQDLRFAGPLLSLLSLSGAVVLVAMGGPEERYLIYPTSVAAFFLMRPGWALTACLLAIVAMSSMLLPVMAVFSFGKFLLSVGGCCLFAYIFAQERNVQRDELLSLSTRDPLTGIGNRRALDDQVRELRRIQERQPGAVSLLLLDLDNFKMVNDTHGHDAGDQLLKEVANLINSRLRAGDHAFRYGGDEFAVLAMGDGARILADRLCDQVVDMARERDLPVSVSVGLARLIQDESSDMWIKRADNALYRAKSGGRNQVCEAPDQMDAQSGT